MAAVENFAGFSNALIAVLMSHSLESLYLQLISMRHFVKQSHKGAALIVCSVLTYGARQPAGCIALRPRKKGLRPRSTGI